jgi:hypothetical protein
MTDVMTKITLSADVTGLATAVAGLRKGFEGPSTVNVHRDARRECARRGVHCCKVVVVEGCERRNEKGARGGAAYVIGVGVE